jgi:threonine dehydrogenase-like Zn-dependent dehydrogenase
MKNVMPAARHSAPGKLEIITAFVPEIIKNDDVLIQVETGTTNEHLKPRDRVVIDPNINCNVCPTCSTMSTLETFIDSED